MQRSQNKTTRKFRAIALSIATLLFSAVFARGAIAQTKQNRTDLERRQQGDEALELDDLLQDENFSLSRNQDILAKVSREAGIQPAVVHIKMEPESIVFSVIPAKGEPFQERVWFQGVALDSSGEVTISQRSNRAIEMIEELRYLLRHEISEMEELVSFYLTELYQYLIAPIEDKLGDTDTLLFSVSEELRHIPFSALYDEASEQYLVEKYAVSLIPSISLIQHDYNPSFVNSPILAMGATDFSNHPQYEQASLPSVALEISFLKSFFGANTFLNENFTSEILIEERRKKPYEIVHFSTHAKLINETEARLYFWDRVHTLESLRDLNWNDGKPIELLVLSASETALGNDREELGIAGLTVRAGVKSAIAALWDVDAKAMFVLMTQLYENLLRAKTEDGRSPTKAEALRQAQIAMIRGEVRIEDGQVVWQNPDGEEIAIAIEAGYIDLSDLKYWAGFTLVGSPW